MTNILVVDDDILINLALKKWLETAGYSVKTAFSGSQSFVILSDFDPDIILLDYRLPDTDGFTLLKKYRKTNPRTAVIMITSYGDIPTAVAAIKAGATDFLPKPVDKNELLRLVNLLSLQQEPSLSYEDVTAFMGNSPALQQVLQDINRVSKHDITVFLEGETGTGKELFARMIHARSPRRDKPFIPVDCGAIPETLFESELFGHLKGAFTGAISDKKGKFELAGGGTLFLDEINSLPQNLQPKFLRVLQENEFQKLGDEKSTHIDVRIIAASNNNIYEDVKKGSFREDLFYRLHEFKIDLPTLQQRREDIMVIARYFLQECREKYQKDISDFSAAAAEVLQNYDWPGNIRELKNAVKSAVILCNSHTIATEHLHLKNIRKLSSEFQPARTPENEAFSLKNLTSKTEEEMIVKALQKTRYNKTEAAKLLGISRSKFYKILEKIDLHE
ncbi:MAG TPA: sigma-54 dependent transcriptional regulator [Candidatus Cloacimonadota bacterium]|nr:sigma-54 dependent transcriptional regulator [Candidatus Cloacimonadota bacterium]